LSYANIGGRWGELRFGRDYTPQFWNLAVYDPFFTNGAGTTQAINSILFVPTAIRASNSVGYFLPPGLGGFYGQVMYHFGENPHNGAANESDGNGSGLRIGFANGPFDVAVTTSRTSYATGDVHQTNAGGSWTFGALKLMAEYSRDRFGIVHGKGGLLGGSFDIGPGQVRASYSRYETDAAGDPASKKIAIGYIYNLSKRTALYATYAHVSNSGGATQALNGALTGASMSSTGTDLGLKHTF
jgi:predicted porin